MMTMVTICFYTKNYIEYPKGNSANEQDFTGKSSKLPMEFRGAALRHLRKKESIAILEFKRR